MRMRTLTLLFLLGLLAACGAAAPTPTPTAAPTVAPSPTTAAAGAAEGQELHLLCSVPADWCESIIKPFEERTGIKVTYERLSAGEALTKLRETKENPEFDIYHGGPSEGYIAAKNEGLFEPLATSALLTRIPTQLRDPDNNWAGTYVGVLGFCINPEALERLGVEVPDSWDDLLDPKLKGQIIMAHPAASGTAYTVIWTHVTLNDGDQDKAMDYMKQLDENVVRYTRSGSAINEAVISGEVAVAPTFSHGCLRPGPDGRTTTIASFPSEGTGYEVGSIAMIKGARHPEAARAYLDWALSKEGQEAPFNANWFVLPTNPEATVLEQAPGTAKLLDYDPVAAGSARDALVERFVQEVAPLPPE